MKSVVSRQELRQKFPSVTVTCKLKHISPHTLSNPEIQFKAEKAAPIAERCDMSVLRAQLEPRVFFDTVTLLQGAPFSPIVWICKERRNWPEEVKSSRSAVASGRLSCHASCNRVCSSFSTARGNAVFIGSQRVPSRTFFSRTSASLARLCFNRFQKGARTSVDLPSATSNCQVTAAGPEADLVNGDPLEFG
uniref:Uncharacterized protein n=1 Tax=Candidatus Kentrum sp. TC TaxID=2126339 RepID=A0A450ZQA9_9GAMM|nr:MAG: hypothetical protein BECKTC1821F_GA0114240_100849 [Candidatus Kentron sp. TC]